MPSVSLLNDQFSHDFQYVLALTRYEFIQSYRQVLLEAVAGFRAACAAVASVLILARAAPVRGDVLLEAPPPRLPVRGGCRILRDNLGDGLHDLLERR